jgi:hypothetical protein
MVAAASRIALININAKPRIAQMLNRQPKGMMTSYLPFYAPPELTPI